MPVEGVTSSTPPISKTTAFTAMGAFSSVLTASLRAPSQGGPGVPRVDDAQYGQEQQCGGGEPLRRGEQAGPGRGTAGDPAQGTGPRGGGRGPGRGGPGPIGR